MSLKNGGGSYRLMTIVRWVMVVVFVSFGMQKFTLQSAQGIVQCISNSPFISWLSVFGLRGEAYVLGVAQFAIAALLVAGVFSPILSAVGSLMGVVTFAITWSFFFTTPGVVVSCCSWLLCRSPLSDHGQRGTSTTRQALSSDGTIEELKASSKSRHPRMSTRELEVAARVKAGMSARQIAADLGIAETTVITHRNQRRLRPHWRGEPPRTAARLA
jgi:uncharacterized membrane protein YphA (DoxX/SURF4 family)